MTTELSYISTVHRLAKPVKQVKLLNLKLLQCHLTMNSSHDDEMNFVRMAIIGVMNV